VTGVRSVITCTSATSWRPPAWLSEDWHGPVVIGTGTSLSVLDVLEAVRAVSGAELPVRHGPAKPGEMPAVIVDPSRAKSRGWAPRFNFAEGLAGVWDEWSKADIQPAPEVLGAAR